MNYGSQIIVMACGIYCIVKGLIILFTGKVTQRELTRLETYSETGVKRYKLLTAVMNIIGGLAIIAIAAVRVLDILDRNTSIALAGVLLAVLIIFYIVILKSCKNAK